MALSEHQRCNGFRNVTKYHTLVHSEVVNSVAHLGGEFMVLGCADGTILVWNWKTGEKLRALRTEGDEVHVVVHLEGDFIAAIFRSHPTRLEREKLTSAWNKIVIVWNWRTGKMLWKLEHCDPVISIAFLGNDFLVTGCDFTDATVWNWRTGEELHTLKGHTDSVTSVSFSPDGKRILSGSFDVSVRVWDASPLANPGKTAFPLQGRDVEPPLQPGPGTRDRFSDRRSIPKRIPIGIGGR